MRRTLVAGLSCLALTVAVHTVYALVAVARPAPVPQRVAAAEHVIVGKVTAIEAKAIKAERFPGDPQKAEYSIAVVKVDEALSGAKGLTHVKVGFLPLPGGDSAPVDNIKPIRRPPIRMQPVQLVKDQEVCLYLQPHHKEAFYIVPSTFDAVDKKAPNFAQEVAEAKRYGQLLNDPMAGLKSKEADERFRTATVLLLRYRLPRAGASRQEPIDAAESKLILEAIAGANWDARLGPNGELPPRDLFQRFLPLQPKDGWTQPADFTQFAAAAKEWLTKNAGTYRIQRFVVEDKK